MTEQTEREVLAALSENEREFLKRVLELERSRLHVVGADVSDALLAAVKEILK
jgi:hypothetical protein